LLVVIAIIAILAAILFPVFSKAREKARAIVCLSNVKQIALACQMYMNDWEDSFPIYMDTNATRWWGVQLDPYIRNAGVWHCPSVSAVVTGNMANQNQGQPYNYACNGDLFAKLNPTSYNSDWSTLTLYDGYDDGVQCPGGQGGTCGGPHGAYSLSGFGLSDASNVPVVFCGSATPALAKMSGLLSQDLYTKLNPAVFWYLWSPLRGVGAKQVIIQGYACTALSGSGPRRTDGIIGGTWYLMYFRHQNGTNVGFADGHAAWKGEVQNWAPDWMNGLAGSSSDYPITVDTSDRAHYVVSNVCPVGHVNWWPATYIN